MTIGQFNVEIELNSWKSPEGKQVYLILISTLYRVVKIVV